MFFVCLSTVAAQLLKQAAICPQICNCTQVSDQCFLCLENKFNRNYTIQIKACPCLSGYNENTPPTDYCCANNCSSCYKQGCYQCRTNWTKILSQDEYICDCKSNYQYVRLLNDCLCLSDINPINQHKFYAPSRFQCYACPQGCSCDGSGCYSCPEDTNREIKLTISNIWSCLCKINYVEDQKGSCIMKVNCPANRTLINNTCVCDQPYYQILGQCHCKSYINYTLYYMYKGICYPCPARCICNKYGCIYCSSQAQRYIYENHCRCNNQSIQIDSECICISPYDPFCNCNSKYAQYALIFYYYNNTQNCFKCPKGCQCNQIAQYISCDSSTHRNENGKCIQPFRQLDGQCIDCQDNFIYINNRCICPTITHNLSLFYDQSKEICQQCPVGCSCNQTGCYQCDQSLNRIIQSNSQNKFTCYCNASNLFKQNSFGICECISPYIYDSTTKNCSCKDPYQLVGDNCQCKSIKNQTGYYNPSSGCKPCPKQCTCSDIGCIKCNLKTGRIIIRQNPQSLLFICPCFPIRLNQTNGYCTTCLSDQYFWQNSCINCQSGCLTCNEKGCITCSQNLKLEKNKCICSNKQAIGQCSCQRGFFADPISKNCLSCPEKCLNCQLNIVLSGIINCIECNTSNFRKNDTKNNCPCIDYYVEAPIPSPYCCHWSCVQCNMSGCLSCLPFTFRELNDSDPKNVTCSCINGFIQNYHTFCECQNGTYLFSDQCLPCPGYCLECIRINQIINCLVCKPGLNRKSSLAATSYQNNRLIYSYDCLCDQNYLPYANQQYCYPKGCITISNNGTCDKCNDDRNRNQNGSACNCKSGKYEDSYFNCLNCSDGCIQCISYEICKACNTNKNYYLIFDKKTKQIKCIIPKSNKRIIYQNLDNKVFEFTQQQQQAELTNIQIYLIQLDKLNTYKNTTKLNILRFNRRNDKRSVYFLEFNRLAHDQLDWYLLYVNSTDNDYQAYFLMQNQIYKRQTLINPYIQNIFIIMFIAFVMAISLILHILGQKNNQLIYYCHTIYFVAMNVKDSHMYIVPLLNYFRITTFNFTFDDSGSPFNGLLADWTLFIEDCKGNYKYFSMDNNLIRNAGLALYLNIQTIFFSIVFRIIYYFLYKSKYKPFLQKHKKLVYRSMQWMYKMTMYPLIFYSLSTIINYHKQYSLVNEQFRQLNFRLSVLILICYTVITVIQIAFQDISKIQRYDIVIQYIFNIINSVVIVYSVYNWFIFLLILPLFLRSILQYMISRSYMSKFSLLYNYINILNILSCSVIITIYFNNKISTITLLLSYIFGLTIMRILLIRIKYIHYKFEKKSKSQESIKEIYSECKFINEPNQISQPKQGSQVMKSAL